MFFVYMNVHSIVIQNSDKVHVLRKNFQMYKLDLEKAEEPEIKLPTATGSLKKQENFRKKHLLCFIYYGKAFDCVEHNKLWTILQEIGIPAHLICLLKNLYAGQEEDSWL